MEQPLSAGCLESTGVVVGEKKMYKLLPQVIFEWDTTRRFRKNLYECLIIRETPVASMIKVSYSLCPCSPVQYSFRCTDGSRTELFVSPKFFAGVVEVIVRFFNPQSGGYNFFAPLLERFNHLNSRKDELKILSKYSQVYHRRGDNFLYPDLKLEFESKEVQEKIKSAKQLQTELQFVRAELGKRQLDNKSLPDLKTAERRLLKRMRLQAEWEAHLCRGGTQENFPPYLKQFVKK